MKRFDVDLSGRIEFGNGEFLGVIATIAVTSIHDIDDFVFSAAFRTFDHVCIESVPRHIEKSTIVITNYDIRGIFWRTDGVLLVAECRSF